MEENTPLRLEADIVLKKYIEQNLKESTTETRTIKLLPTPWFSKSFEVSINQT